MPSNDEGKTPDTNKSSTCPMHVSGAGHYWKWLNFLDVGQPLKRVCSTCGEVQTVQRFQGQ